MINISLLLQQTGYTVFSYLIAKKLNFLIILTNFLSFLDWKFFNFFYLKIA
jgi:hypothetical protein